MTEPVATPDPKGLAALGPGELGVRPITNSGRFRR